MVPNYNFDNELPQKWGVDNYELRSKLDILKIKYVCITQKEYDVMMWICCNLPSVSPLKKGIIKIVKELIKIENNNEIGNIQIIMDL